MTQEIRRESKPVTSGGDAAAEEDDCTEGQDLETGRGKRAPSPIEMELPVLANPMHVNVGEENAEGRSVGGRVKRSSKTFLPVLSFGARLLEEGGS